MSPPKKIRLETRSFAFLGATRGLNLSAARRILSKSSMSHEDSFYITGLALSVSFGGALNFWITGSLGKSTGLSGTLWLDVGIAGVSFVPAIILSVALRRSEKKEQIAALTQKDIAHDSLNWADALGRKNAPATYWWITGHSFFLLSTIHVFIANAPQMIQVKYPCKGSHCAKVYLAIEFLQTAMNLCYFWHIEYGKLRTL